jgi:S-adenosylmethionine synthetase
MSKTPVSTQFVAESVAAGHPDKIADQISDSILDACLAADPFSRVAVETLVTTNKIVLAGEISSRAVVDYAAVAREVIRRLGYTQPEWGFCDQSPVEIYIHQQAADIAQGVEQGGAGDQGMMFGYACDETPELMPLPIMLAHQLVRGMDEARESGALSYLRPDGKAQVVIEYVDGQPVAPSTVILAVPHQEDISNQQLETDLWQTVVIPALSKYFPKLTIDRQQIQFIVNGTGTWHVGGPAADTGLTGRKIIVDTYGGMIPHGGGAFSGKDPSKVDRSAAYACRFLAKNIVAQGLARRVQLRVAYVIGRLEPVAFAIDTFGTARQTEAEIRAYALGLLDMSVPAIIKQLDLRTPVFAKTAAYGHFGRAGVSWERVV